MKQVDSIEFVASAEMLQKSLEEKKLPESLLSPFQSLLKSILEMANAKPISIYLCSADENSLIRNYFAFSLTKLLVEHIPSAILVDLDFLNMGMSGIIPNKDALGFLDYLLYGSSLGVITQEAPQDVRVICAGSFPMTKKMPISVEAFEDAARRMESQSRLVVFCGPAQDDEGNIHPVAGTVDLPIYVRYAPRFPVGRIDPFEEKLSTFVDKRLLSVRISPSGAVVGEGEEIVPLHPEEETVHRGEKRGLVREAEEITAGAGETAPVDAAGRDTVGAGVGTIWEETGETSGSDEVPTAGEYTGLPFEKKKGGSLFPKIATFLVGGFLIVFLFWWFFLTKNVREAGEGMELAAVDTAAVDGKAPGTDTLSVAVQDRLPVGIEGETAGDEAGRPGEAATEPVIGKEDEPSDVLPAEPSSSAPEGEEICITEDFTDFAGKYLVHISSFRDIEKAKSEVGYLTGKNFSACVVSVDLGAKGKWFRVYAGPVETREEARELKIMLDELPRVKFTRITRAPGFPRS